MLQPVQFRRGCGAVGVFLAIGVADLVAQQLPFRTSTPASTPFECRSWTPPPPPPVKSERYARELASSAAESVILGELERARALLERALELDAGSSELNDRYARVLADLGLRGEAIEALCRVIATEEGVAHPDVRARLDSLVAQSVAEIPAPARTAFERGIHAGTGGRPDAALESFAVAASDAPAWPAAAYNHGVALDRTGRRDRAIAELRRYLALEPAAGDAVAVSHRIGQLEAERAEPEFDRGAALALGLAVPGLGQLHAGRPRAGLVVLSSVGAIVAAGLMTRETAVRCLTETLPGGDCPATDVLSESTRRPYLRSALVAAGVVSVLGAIEAAVRGGPRGIPPERGWSVGQGSSPGPGADRVVLLRLGVGE